MPHANAGNTWQRLMVPVLDELEADRPPKGPAGAYTSQESELAVLTSRLQGERLSAGRDLGRSRASARVSCLAQSDALPRNRAVEPGTRSPCPRSGPRGRDDALERPEGVKDRIPPWFGAEKATLARSLLELQREGVLA